MDEVRIAMVLNKESAYWREVVQGVLHFARSQPHWTLHSVPKLDDKGLALLSRWKPAGIIAEIPTNLVEDRLATFGVPVVSVSHIIASDRYPRVGVDDELVGVAIAEHLLARGFREFVSVCPETEATLLRRNGFESAIRRAGLSFRIHTQPTLFTLELIDGWSSLDRKLGDWLTSLPRPLGMMLDDDDLGMWVTQACKMAGLIVPDDIAIVGVNDDSINCELCNPSLSSLGMPKRGIGQMAGSMLERLLAGGRLDRRVVSLRPLVITERHSSNILAVGDADVASAVRFIERASSKPLSVHDVLGEVPVARRILERKFRSVLGRSPLQEIRRAHMERAKRLLVTTDFKLDVVAERSGFGTVYHLCRMFKRETSQTPMEFRRHFRLRD